MIIADKTPSKPGFGLAGVERRADKPTQSAERFLCELSCSDGQIFLHHSCTRRNRTTPRLCSAYVTGENGMALD